MSKFSRPWFWAGPAPALAGALVLLQLLAARLFASADAARVYVLGGELVWGCFFKSMTGLPCPACGLTRSVLLSLHGRLGEALSVNPAGPLLVAGLALLGAGLVALPLYRRARDPHTAGRLRARLSLAGRAYAGLLFAVLFAHWVAELFARQFGP